MQIGKEKNKTVSVCRLHNIIHRNPKDITKILLLELNNEFDKVAGYKLIYRNLLYFYTLTMSYQKVNLGKQPYLYNLIKKNNKFRTKEWDSRKLVSKEVEYSDGKNTQMFTVNNKEENFLLCLKHVGIKILEINSMKTGNQELCT